MQTQSHQPDIVPPDNPPPGPPDSNGANGGSERMRLFTMIMGLISISFVVLLLAGFDYRRSHPDSYANYQKVPIQATSLLGGAEQIGPGQWLTISRYTGGTGGTPVAEEWRIVGQVAAVSGNETAKQIVVLAVPTPNQVSTLQAALAVKDGPPLAYTISKEQPTPTPSPTDAPAPSIAPTASSDQVGLGIPAERIAPGAPVDQVGLQSLIIVPKEAAESGDTVSSPPLFIGCATFAFFLDKDRLLTDKAAKAQTIVVWLHASRLPEAAAALTHAERVYLAADASCHVRQTPSPTPSATPSSTPSPSATPSSTPSPTPPGG